jgi:uncharacterized protein with PQ loop repeat
MEAMFTLGFIAGAVVTSGSVAAALRALRTRSVSDYSWWFVVSQLVGCFLYSIYMWYQGAWAAMYWTIISVLCFGIICYVKSKEIK